MMLKTCANFFLKVSRTVWFQLPLFIMLVVFSTVPTYFGGYYCYKTYIVVVLPQVILGTLLLSMIASFKKWLWWIIFAAANLLFFVELGCYFCQHSRFNSVISVLIMQTNFSESKEFVDFAIVPIFKAMTLSICMALAFWICNYYWQKGLAEKSYRILKINRWYVGGMVGFIMACSIFYSPVLITAGIKEYGPDWKRFSPMADASTYITYYYNVKDTFLNPDMQNLDVLENTIADLSVTSDHKVDELTIVYVIGESFGRSRSSLYGYPLETNPNLQKELTDSSLIVFDNVITHSVRTIDIYRYMLSTYDILSGKRYVDSPLLPAVLKKGGYKVAYYDNQSVIGNTQFDFGCTYFFGNKNIRETSIDLFNTVKYDYDGLLVDKFPPLTDSALNLTIYHLMGQHVQFRERYPDEYNSFSAKDYPQSLGYTPEQAKTVAEFDNATRYNDFVLSKIIGSLKDKTAILIYASDHGEEVYDIDDKRGRGLTLRVGSIRPLCEVPVMVWVSDRYKSLYSEKVENLRKNAHKAIYNSDLSHTVIDAAGVSTATFNPELSLLSKGKGRTDRIILMNNYKYDLNRDKIRAQKLRYEKTQ